MENIVRRGPVATGMLKCRAERLNAMQLASFLHARLRSTTGVSIGLYVTMHLCNHALGLVSLDAQEAARPYVMALWHSLPGQPLLYGSLVIHAVCALVALSRRR